MSKKAELTITDSYYKVFDILTDKLAGKTQSLSEKNVIFCEEKISLMAERAICAKFNGTFNTDVYSFVNYLKSRRKIDALSREGSAMVVKRILIDLPLSVLKAGKTNLAPTLFDLIIQLKSAAVSPDELKAAVPYLPEGNRGKVEDIAAVYKAYEEFIAEHNLTDQSSVLNYLSEEIEKDEKLKGARVILLGYNSLTKQARRAILSLLKVAGEVIFIATGGENRFLFVNEIEGVFRDLCKTSGITPEEIRVPSYDKKETEVLSKKLFNLLENKNSKEDTDDIFINQAANPESEIHAIAGTIAVGVKGGAKYRDYTVALPDVKAYGKYIKYYFNLFDVPYFIDEKITPDTYPLIRLILSYFDVFRKNRERSAVVSFFKNPLFCDDKNLTDFMENYLIRYNVNYGNIEKPFTFGGDDLTKAEEFRKRITPYVRNFDLAGMLKGLNVKERNENLTQLLRDRGESVAAEVNSQLYEAVMKILGDMDKILSGTEITVSEMKNIFKSGVAAMQISVIPQYYDAVYVGDYRKTALAKAKNLFAPFLTSSVPAVKEDVALLTDDDIKNLNKKTEIDPTVRIVNLREKENFGVSLLAFSDKLYLSYPQVDGGGKKTVPSEAIKYFSRSFNLKTYSFDKRYVAEKESILRFAEDCEAFSKKKKSDITEAAAFYTVSDNPIKEDILAAVKKELKIQLEGFNRELFSAASPTRIEDYHKCPYMVFLSRVLRLNADDGEFSAISVGNVMHGIFKEYFSNLKDVKDRESSDALFERSKEAAFKNTDYDKFFSDEETKELMERVLTEAKNYCYKYFCNLNKTSFKPVKFEEKINYRLPESKVNLYGSVDRVDKYTDGENEYLRIIDYKTGKVEDDDNLLYAGLKLQLYLYAAAFRNETAKISGMYYSPIKEEYADSDKKNRFLAVGKTLADENAINAQHLVGNDDGVAFADDIKSPRAKKERSFPEEVINACIDYAVNICDLAVKRMREGVIVAFPYEGSCGYCPYSAICKKPFGENYRSVSNMTCAKISTINGEEK